MRPEHKFNVTITEWEEAVFGNADHIVVYRHVGRTRRTFPDWPSAKADAETDARALVYAVAASGRSVLLEHKNWPKYDELWAKKVQETA